MARHLSKEDLVEAAASIYDMMLESKTDTEIMESLRMDAETFGSVKKFMLDERATVYRTMTREQTFVQYVIAKRAIIKTIDEYVGKMDDIKQFGSVVGALRLRSDIEEQIITRGQEFGLFKKTPERKELIAGVLHADMSTAELTKALFDKHKVFTDAIKKFGDGDILSLPAKPLHYGESALTVKGEVIEDDEADLPPPVAKDKGGPKRRGGRSGKHTGFRERRPAADE